MIQTYDPRGNGGGCVTNTITGDHESRITDYTALVVEMKEPILLESNQNHATITENGICPSLVASMGMGGGYIPMVVNDMKVWATGNGQLDQIHLKDKVGALNCMHDQQTVTIKENDMEEKYIVRRLTPVECERLQGFPDGWTSPWEDGMWEDEQGKKHKVAMTHRYKAIGNSIGIPSWLHIMKGCSQVLKESGVDQPLMGSLFDGIGGFPLMWEHFNGKGSAVWASEVEPFCIAVTKYHFPEGEGR